MKKKNDVSKPSYEIIATHAPIVPLDKREGTIYTYINGITVLGPLSVGRMRFLEQQLYIYIYCCEFAPAGVRPAAHLQLQPRRTIQS